MKLPSPEEIQSTPLVSEGTDDYSLAMRQESGCVLELSARYG